MNKILFIFILLTIPVLSSSCKKGLNGACNKDKDCKSGLICEGHKCLKHIDCNILKQKYTACIKDIFTVRNPSYKPTKAEINFQLKKFNDSYYKECKRERGAYEDEGIEKCLTLSGCTEFAKCLLNLEK